MPGDRCEALVLPHLGERCEGENSIREPGCHAILHRQRSILRQPQQAQQGLLRLVPAGSRRSRRSDASVGGQRSRRQRRTRRRGDRGCPSRLHGGLWHRQRRRHAGGRIAGEWRSGLPTRAIGSAIRTSLVGHRGCRCGARQACAEANYPESKRHGIGSNFDRAALRLPYRRQGFSNGPCSCFASQQWHQHSLQTGPYYACLVLQQASPVSVQAERGKVVSNERFAQSGAQQDLCVIGLHLRRERPWARMTSSRRKRCADTSIRRVLLSHYFAPHPAALVLPDPVPHHQPREGCPVNSPPDIASLVHRILQIANRIKAKGLQKLRWYCQMCGKQCRDENGFKCHLSSDSHQRQMMVFGQVRAATHCMHSSWQCLHACCVDGHGRKPVLCSSGERMVDS